MEREPVLRCERLVKVYESASGRVQAVRGVDLEFDAEATVALIGPSGCGKSSLLRMLAGLDHPTAGSVLISGCDLFAVSAGRRAKLRADLVTFVRQRPSDNLIGHLTAIQQLDRVALPGPDRHSRIIESLEMLGLGSRSQHLAADLSGGEQQRLAFAKAMVAGHTIVIADEPTAHLDRVGVDATFEAMSAMKLRGITVIVATHDSRVIDHVDQIIRLRDGAVSTVTESGTEFAVIDRSGRLQLPPEVVARLPGRRVVLSVDDQTGRTVLDPPQVTPPAGDPPAGGKVSGP